MIVYLDTSALVKLLFEEDGSALAAELWERADGLVSSNLVYAEARAALAAARRAERISSASAAKARTTLGTLCEDIRLVGVDGRLTRLAGDLAERHALRGYDAVHLATALSMDAADELVLATWDRDLSRAALSAGLPVAP